MPIDIVIPLGSGSHWQDNELRFALRSVQQHLSGFRDVYIVGKKPLSISMNFCMVSAQDQSLLYPAKNIYTKILKCCNIDEISDPFLFMNDDHFLLNNFEASQFPYFFKGYLKDELHNKTDYKHTIENTINALANTHPYKNFDTHTPILYYKKLFIETLDIYNWSIPHAYAIKSIYCNSLKIPGVYEPDAKIKRCNSTDRIKQFLESKKVFSVDDPALNHDMKKFLKNTYPNKSKFEL